MGSDPAYEERTINSLSVSEKKRLRDLTFRDESEMLDEFSFLVKNRYNNKKSRAFIVIVDGRAIGWALLSGRHDDSQTYVYVQRKFRRQGIGSNLLKMAKTYADTEFKEEPRVVAHDETSKKFFESLGNVNIEYWWGTKDEKS
jgi:GNAT superfamily N-acetyltransferase